MQATSTDDLAALDAPALEREALPSGPPFDGGARDERSFGGASGLRLGLPFTDSELARLREIVRGHLAERARALSPAAAADLAAADLELYHEAAARLDHARLLSKAGRILPAGAAAEILSMSAFDGARAAFGADMTLADEEGVGWGQVCLRVVRPGRREDVGSLHADAWFWEHHGWNAPPGAGRVKIWAGICVDAERNGLLLAPGSHRMEAPHRVASEGGKLAFEPAFDVAALDLRRFMGAPGDPVFFNYRTLHMGSLNRASTTRVSLEATILFRETGTET